MSQDQLKIFASKVKMPLAELPIKSVLIKEGEKVLLISPLPEIERLAQEVSQWGPVTDILAPNSFHTLGLKGSQELFPKARFWGLEAVRKKKHNISWFGDPSSTDWPYESVEVLPLEGMPFIDEALLFHKPSQSLIVTDLCFNHLHAKGLGARIIFSLFGTYKKFAISRLFKMWIKDTSAFRDSLDRLFEWPFNKIVIPHGENIEENAKEKLKQALREKGLYE